MARNKGVKRKTPPSGAGETTIPTKRLKTPQNQPKLGHSLLRQAYSKVQTLREYLLENLPSSSKLRRKKIATLGTPATEGQGPRNHNVTKLCHLLDSSLVASTNDIHLVEDVETRWSQWQSFSQRPEESYVSLSDSVSDALYSQSEVE